ncbi:helix-turn-helix domain-containing protein [Turicibacter sanguinis]|uniref:helix-turn-helix domain-containing protein n=1 Tax=Turicibacter sanguinis TaxID=154288 RepID=UPI0006C1FD7F|nr:helix-turn-helix domain-containing protein [Turicibacter sanguinis]MDB8437755.1 helix-turn-helix domain-containing protein [Turicibacter sanguinis]CUN04710.1 DNA binding domain%2C excisionase family [Turicibacter sanguinis]
MAKVEVPVRDKLLLTLDDVAALLSTSVPTVRKLAKMGIIPFLKMGTKTFVDMNELKKGIQHLTYKRIDLERLEVMEIDCSDIGA